jgi:hypothetical protein
MNKAIERRTFDNTMNKAIENDVATAPWRQPGYWWLLLVAACVVAYNFSEDARENPDVLVMVVLGWVFLVLVLGIQPISSAIAGSTIFVLKAAVLFLFAMFCLSILFNVAFAYKMRLAIQAVQGDNK